MECRRIVLDEVDDPPYARRRGNAGSAATSVSFALLRDVISDQGSRHALQPLGHARSWCRDAVRGRPVRSSSGHALAAAFPFGDGFDGRGAGLDLGQPTADPERLL